ncbi:MAG TPA: hypothetical protein ENK13_05585, partial [Thermopetrobacter sp.]|nr:hypothetical protein [Thermopetrobacter sp.]
MNDATGTSVSESAGERGGGPGGWLIAALLVSLALNMLVLGAVGTMAYFHYSGRLPPWARAMP